MKKIIALFLAMCMLLPVLIACKDTASDDAQTTEATVVTTLEETAPPAPTELSLIASGISEYTIIRPSDCQSFITDAMSELRHAVENKYGVDLKPKEDWEKDVKKGEAYITDAPEILIGATNRKESIDALATLESGQYKICVSGNKLVLIGSSDYLTAQAVHAFIEYMNTSADSETLSVPLDYSVLKSQEDMFGLLMGITMYAMGDSYFGGSSLGKEATWVNKLGHKYEMDFVNYGIGGSTMSDFITEKNPMVQRYTQMAKGDADIILLEGGRNDRSQKVPLGDLDSRDSKTFLGSINIMLDGMLETYPNALIILITPWYHTGRVTATGLANIDYANAMRDLAEHRNDKRIVCLYAADPDTIGVNMNDASFRAKYCIKPDDVSHLNDEGMNMVLPIMEQFIATEFAKFKGAN